MSDREEYQQQFEDQLAGWQADFVHLQDMVAAAHGNVHPEKAQRIRELERRIAVAKAKLPELAAASEENWPSVKEAVESAVFMTSDSKS
jgi:hypothetical protein